MKEGGAEHRSAHLVLMPLELRPYSVHLHMQHVDWVDAVSMLVIPIQASTADLLVEDLSAHCPADDRLQ